MQNTNEPHIPIRNLFILIFLVLIPFDFASAQETVSDKLVEVISILAPMGLILFGINAYFKGKKK